MQHRRDILSRRLGIQPYAPCTFKMAPLSRAVAPTDKTVVKDICGDGALVCCSLASGSYPADTEDARRERPCKQAASVLLY